FFRRARPAEPGERRCQSSLLNYRVVSRSGQRLQGGRDRDLFSGSGQPADRKVQATAPERKACCWYAAKPARSNRTSAQSDRQWPLKCAVQDLHFLPREGANGLASPTEGSGLILQES